MPHPALVLIPHGHGYSHYDVAARTSLAAATKALALHPFALADEVIITVIVDGVGPLVDDWRRRNADKAMFFHYAGRVRDEGRSVVSLSPPSRMAN